MACPAALRSAVIVALLASLVGCSSTGAAGPDRGWQEWDEFDDFDLEEVEKVFDPLGGYNRVMFKFNDMVYVWVWDPVARGWRWIVPQGVRVAVDRAFKNVVTPVRFGNCLLQLKFKEAGSELGRMLVNSTLGIGGLFDPADSWFGWTAPSPEDFGQTLGRYGIGGGFPVVLPFLGPSNVRDGLGLLADGVMFARVYDLSGKETVGMYIIKKGNHTSLHIGEYESLKQDALDPYTMFRDVNRQNRDGKIGE